MKPIFILSLIAIVLTAATIPAVAAEIIPGFMPLRDHPVTTGILPDPGPYAAPGIEDYGFVTSWGNISGTGNGELCNPYGIAIGDDEYIYIADTENNRVQKFTSGGSFVSTWGTKGTGDSEFDWPCAIAVGGDGLVYVADSGNHRIQVFGTDGTFVRSWGSKGNGTGEFFWPQGIAVGGDGLVYVAESGNTTASRCSRQTAPS